MTIDSGSSTHHMSRSHLASPPVRPALQRPTHTGRRRGVPSAAGKQLADALFDASTNGLAGIVEGPFVSITAEERAKHRCCTSSSEKSIDDRSDTPDGG
jgi:hypothetical protein